jgi:hypothetical protein
MEIWMSKRLTPIAAAFLAVSLLFGGPAASQSMPPETMAAARELVAAMRAGEQFKAVLPIILQQLKPIITQGRPEVARDFDAVLPALQELVNTRSDAMASMLEGIVAVYARNFTVEEMRQITAFYGQPIGQKLLDKMPIVAQESMAVGQQWGQSIATELQKLVTEELRKRGHKI